MQDQAASDVSPIALASRQDDLVRAVRGGSVDTAFGAALEAAPAILRHALRARIVSARMVALQRAERVGFHSSSIGHEGGIVPAVLAMSEDDWVFPGVREWSASLVRGLPFARYVHHAFGSKDDPAKGHAAPDHLPARSVRIVPPSGVLAAHLPQAVGAAWAAKIRKDPVVALVLFGAEARESGDFHNALNFAGVVRAPVVFVCRSGIDERVADRAVAYGIAHARVDGSDMLAVHTVVRAARARAHEGNGPTFVELASPSLGDLGSLTDAALAEGDVLDLGEHDPIARLRRVLAIDAETEAAIVREARSELDAAIEAAERAGAPRPETMFDDVYAVVPAHLAAQRQKLIGG